MPRKGMFTSEYIKRGHKRGLVSVTDFVRAHRKVGDLSTSSLHLQETDGDRTWIPAAAKPDD